MDPSDARCRPDQVQACSAAVGGKSLSTFSYGGECVQNQYDVYDQLCTLNFYTPGADYCCCAHGRKALCCRFHFDHKYFRCDEEQDTINVPLSLTSTLIISGIVFAVVAIIVIVVVVKCVKGRRAVNERMCCDSSSAGSDDDKEASPEHTRRHIVTPRHPTSEHDNANTVCDVRSSHPLTMPVIATAPPIDQMGDDSLPELPPYHRTMSEPADLQPSPTPLHGSEHPMYRLDSEHPVRQPLLSVPEAPPAYDDHHHDPKYHPEMDGTTSRAEWF